MNHYCIKLDVDVESKKFYSLVQISLTEQDEGKDLEFLIHGNTKIKKIEVNDSQASWLIKDDVDIPFIPEGKRLVIAQRADIKKLTIIEIELVGQIDIIKYFHNQISSIYVELSLYSPWYPVFLDLRICSADITVSGLEDFYVIKGRKKDEKWHLSFQENDNYLIAFRKPVINNLNLSSPKINLIFANDKEKSEVVETIETSTIEILKYLQDIFKERLPLNNELDIAIAPRMGGGYCRKDLIVMTEHKMNKEMYEKYLTHELSHLWFTGAEVISWEDWLNESFAEYISMLFVEQKYGEMSYIDTIDKLKEYTKNCPPIRNSDRSSEEGSKIRYKGTILLHEFREKFGLDGLVELMRLLISLENKNTDSLIASIEQINEAAADFVRIKVSQ